jgi:hypothetical protein
MCKSPLLRGLSAAMVKSGSGPNDASAVAAIGKKGKTGPALHAQIRL